MFRIKAEASGGESLSAAQHCFQLKKTFAVKEIDRNRRCCEIVECTSSEAIGIG